MRRLFDYRTVPREKRTLILAGMLFGSILSFFLISRFVLTVGVVEGASMVPTLQDGDRYLINRLVYRFHDPRPGDMVEFRMIRADDYSVKRIVALPGDVVQIKQGHVYVNGRMVAEPYLRPGVITEGKAIRSEAFKLPDNVYFVLGDNRAVSMDSRVFGGVNKNRFVGRLWMKLGN